MAGVGKRTYLREVNPYLICPLCRGYLIDATTVVECLHSFCRSCILKHLNTEAHCPSCKHVLNKAKPNIKADKALQDIVYKLVPGLYHKEMRKRREFYKKHPEHADFATPEQRGEDVSGRLIFAPEDAVSLSLEYLPPGADPLSILLSTSDDVSHSNTSSGHNNNNNQNSSTMSNRRYLQCPALVTIAHLKKFLALKYSVDMTRYAIEICHRRAPLPEHWTLMDVAYIYAWKRNAPMRFFYRVALEEQRLEAPPHDRPSTPGLGASLPPIDVAINTKDNTDVENRRSDAESRPEIECMVKFKDMPLLGDESVMASEKSRAAIAQTRVAENKKVEKSNARLPQPSPVAVTTILPTSTTVPVAVTTTTMTTTATNTIATNITNSIATNDSNKQIKTPIKILKNPDGRYEVLRSPPMPWNAKEQISPGTEAKSLNPEFSVVSIGSGQNSNGVKITLKQCSPTNPNLKKPKVISNVLLHSGQVEKDASGALVIQQLHRERDKQQTGKQEKQKRRVTFMEKTTPEKPANNVQKTPIKKPGEQQEKKTFLQGFQLTARESGSDNAIPNSKANVNEVNTTNPTNEIQTVTLEKEKDDAASEKLRNVEDTKKKTVENTGLNAGGNTTNTNKRIAPLTGISSNARVNANKQCSDANTRAFSYTKSSNITVNVTGTNNPAKMDVYTFSNDPPVVPAGAVKRKCPPGVPISDIKRKRQQIPTPPAKKQTPPPLNNIKSPRKSPPEQVIPVKRPASIALEPGPSRIPATVNPKPPGPIFSNDTRNILDGCGLNIPASLSITLTASKSPSSSIGFVEPNDPKDNRKGILGKVSPSITLNDRSVDPRVLKALKTGHIRMPAPPRPRQTKQPDREINQQRQATPCKRKRDQESREILDLSGGKKMEIHPLRIPQPVPKIKPKPPARDLPTISDQGQVVTLMGGHRYYRAPPGSLTPAAHRVTDCPLPTPSRAPVYAPGLSSPLNSSRSNSNLSSVFPSLQSLYALSQAPNLQQFQMDTRLRLPRPSDSNSPIIGSGDNRNMGGSVPGKTHLAAQCAPIKPARSSVAPLAVPIAKQQPNERSTSTCLSRPLSNETKKTPVFRSNESLDSTDTSQQLSVQTKYSPNVESSNRYSPRSTTNNTSSDCNNTENKSAEVLRESNSDSTNESRKQPDNSTQQEPQQKQQHHEAASPRVSSTASPSPPPGDTRTNTSNDVNPASRSENVDNSASGIDNDVPAVSSPTKNNAAAEVSSSKSPASPDSSSVTIESSTTKSCSSVEQDLSSPTQTPDEVKSSDLPAKPDSAVAEESPNDSEKSKVSFKESDGKQLTSEMFQKRLLAAFPSNEWANNPIAAEHLGNFLKSLNASMKPETKIENIGAEKIESQTACNEEMHLNKEAPSKSRTDVVE